MSATNSRNVHIFTEKLLQKAKSYSLVFSLEIELRGTLLNVQSLHLQKLLFFYKLPFF